MLLLLSIFFFRFHAITVKGTYAVLSSIAVESIFAVIMCIVCGTFGK